MIKYLVFLAVTILAFHGDPTFVVPVMVAFVLAAMVLIRLYYTGIIASMVPISDSYKEQYLQALMNGDFNKSCVADRAWELFAISR